jgi:ribonuclease HI
MSNIVIYTDGAARGNPGPGGYGIVLMYGEHKKEMAAGYRLTTNNRMELLAVITALETLKKNDIPVTVYSDSQYVINSVQKGWLNTWVATNFKGGKKNKDLWLRYHAIAKRINVSFVWVKGHASNRWNNRCDELATAAADGRNLLVDDVYEQEAGKT